MRNYISVNAKYYTAKQVSKRAEHNNRSAKIDYLLPLEERKFNNIENNFGQFTMMEKFELMNQKKQQIQKEKGFYKKDGNDLIEMVVSLSEEQSLFYLNQDGGDDKLFSGFQQLAEDIKTKFGFEPCGISLHLDEGFLKPNGDVQYNIHAHLDFLNFDFEKEKTVLRNMKKNDWRHLQDLAQNSFQSKNLDFVRGEQKLDNSKDHLNRNDYIVSKQEREINSNNSKLNSYQNTYTNLIDDINNIQLEYNQLSSQNEELKKEIKDEYTSLNSLKNNVKTLRATFDKDSLDYQNLTTEYHDLQEKEKAKREEYRLLDSKSKTLKEEISKLEVIKKVLEYIHDGHHDIYKTVYKVNNTLLFRYFHNYAKVVISKQIQLIEVQKEKVEIEEETKKSEPEILVSKISYSLFFVKFKIKKITYSYKFNKYLNST